MVDRTQSTRQLTREELAAYLVELAEQFERGEETVSVPVGNKSVTLSPPPELTVDVDVSERSSVLRGTQEKIEIELRWKP